MGEARAWVTLATNDSYSLGALVLAHSLRRVATQYPTVVLITPGVTPIMRERLSTVFSQVVVVDVLDSGDAAHLALLSRPELGITFTKLHCWTLTQYSKCVFLDADTLVLQNCDELFEREELSAAPDVGWPDCFNSGVFVYKPSNEVFQALLDFAKEKGSFDGGDQGLLNSYFSDWAFADIKKHLPFVYNVCSTSFYSYLPALKQFGGNMKILHFIGNLKPWLQSYNWGSRSVNEGGHLQAPLQYWWDLFTEHVHPTLDAAMAGVAGALSQLSLDCSDQSPVVEEHLRRQGWEAGNIDYMGADSFDNIWAKISSTLQGASEPAAPVPVSAEEAPVCPIVRPAEAPACPIVKPAEAPACPIVKPVEAPVCPIVKPVEAPACPIVKPVEAPACPIVKPVEAPACPIVKPVEAPACPIVKPVEAPACPIVKPAVVPLQSQVERASTGSTDSWEQVKTETPQLSATESSTDSGSLQSATNEPPGSNSSCSML